MVGGWRQVNGGGGGEEKAVGDSLPRLRFITSANKRENICSDV